MTEGGGMSKANIRSDEERAARPGHRTALITGATGQDGSYLIEHLLSQKYKVLALVRRVATEDPAHRFWRIRHLLPFIEVVHGDVLAYESICRIAHAYQIDECYHLAAQSFVTQSFEDPYSTLDTNVRGTLNLLQAFSAFRPQCRIYNAASSEMFGKARETPQSEATPFHPRSPYGVSKAAAFYLALNFREARQMYCANGILFNHESPRRGKEFVTRKIATAAVRVKLGYDHELCLGNMDAKRDWGHAADYVRAMHLILQQPTPSDFVVASGETHSVREFCEVAFDELGLDYRDFVRVDRELYRPAEVDELIGDAGKARRELGWAPTYTFGELVREMVQAEVETFSAGLTGEGRGVECARS